MIYNAVSGFVWQFTPVRQLATSFHIPIHPRQVAVAAVSFSVMSLDSRIELTPARAFSALTLFNILRFPLNVFPDLISSLIDVSLFYKRRKRNDTYILFYITGYCIEQTYSAFSITNPSTRKKGRSRRGIVVVVFYSFGYSMVVVVVVE